MSAQNSMARFSTEQLLDALRNWSSDQREREAWKDLDRPVYRYRADLLEATAARLAVLTERLDADEQIALLLFHEKEAAVARLAVLTEAAQAAVDAPHGSVERSRAVDALRAVLAGGEDA